ncbi:MAG: methyltransferase domain-containing protein [Deltaproteobacteria bacterium]|nr:methyltransferase domain-containing protein [Deltaproteobacteria bacterium]MBW2332146.1 methyltransferase domain-containing protein [Deltaproteobacteria bacterium]
MKRRELKYRINWQETWDKMRSERFRKLRVTYDKDFQIKSTEDFSNRCKWNDYESGREVVNILGNILNKDFEALEIGPGPGTLTVPLSEKVRKITCIEASKANLEILKGNLKEKRIKNFELINEYWEKAKIENSFDLVVCSHFLWMVEDIEKHLERMEQFSNRYCVIVQPCGRDKVVKKAFEEICKERYAGQFESDAEYFPYVILREWSRLVDVRHFKYSFELNLEEGIRYIASYLGKFIEVDEQVADKIKNFLIAELDEPWVIRDKAVVIWWKPVK